MTLPDHELTDHGGPESTSVGEVGDVDDAVADGSDESVAEEVLVLQEVDAALMLPVWEPTGDPEVDAALDELGRLAELEPAQHAAVFDGLHRTLHARLSGLASGS